MKQPVLFRRANRDADETLRHVMPAHRADEDALSRHRIADLKRVLVQHTGIDQHKIAFGRIGSQAGHLVDLVEDIIPPFDHVLAFALLVSWYLPAAPARPRWPSG